MIGSKEAQREPLPDGTTVIFLNNKEIVIRSPLAENRNALFYEAFDRNTGRVIVMKEFFPGHWVRHDSAPVLNGWERYSAEEVRRGRLYIWLRHQAEREQQINWKLCCSVRCVIPEKKPLYVGTLRLPDGTEWQRPLGVFLEMDGMTAEPGFPLRALMQECTWPRSPEHPFGNLRRQEGSPGSGRSCAVPAAAVTMRVFRDILLALRQLHDAGWVMGKLDIGDVFVKGNLAGGSIRGVSFVDVSSARKTGESAAPCGPGPGFYVPDPFPGPADEKTDVLLAGWLLLSMLYPIAAQNIRLGRPLDFLGEIQTLTEGESVPSGLPREMRAEVNRLLLRATAPDPEQRISMDEMLATAEDWCRRLER